MEAIELTTNLDLDPWTDLSVDKLPHNIAGRSARIIRAGILPNATLGGKSTVALVVAMPDGSKLVVETTLGAFRMMSVGLLATPQAQMEDL